MAKYIKKILLAFLILNPVFVIGQVKDSLKVAVDTVRNDKIVKKTCTMGTIVDDATGVPLQMINVRYTGGTHATDSDSSGRYSLTDVGSFTKITFSDIGYISITKTIKPGQQNILNIRLKKSNTQLQTVMITSGKAKRYHNKGNPAVTLIQQVIDHKSENRMESTDYLQYDQYERMSLSLFDPPKNLINSKFFSPYKFMFDTALVINGEHHLEVPLFFSEKLYHKYHRKSPSKNISILQAQKETNVIKFIDTAGVDIYLNRLYGNDLDIYENNIFVINNQFLSPIADHAPDFYKFFITDTIEVNKVKFISISFTPRNKGDILFEGKLLVTMDGHYAVEQCELNINKNINVNFIRSLHVNLDFVASASGRYYLKKSKVDADFGILKEKGAAVYGEHTIFYDHYQFDKPLSDDFYRAKSEQTASDIKTDNSYWSINRTDTLTHQQADVYDKMNKLAAMPSYKRLSWIASTITGNFADLGPVQIGPLGATYTYGHVEGSRFQVGARTTPKFNQTIYLEGYEAYGLQDKKLKYDLATYISLNKTPFYRYPNDYFKVSYLYDIGIPGQNFIINRAQVVLSSIQVGSPNNYFQYNKIFKTEYTKEFENHFSFNVGFKNWDQQAAGTLIYQLNDLQNTPIKTLTTSELQLGLRYAPHEQILQGTQERQTIYSKYPIINVQVNHGFKGLINGSYDYTNMGLNIFKRFYLSQLGFTDVTLQGDILAGKIPFPLLNISAANQSIVYDPEAYNKMQYLEFVSDHYIGVNLEHDFNGFFFNKVPLIEHLKWREFLTAKFLYGGLRPENDPQQSAGLYQFPIGADGLGHTYALGSSPYIEAGAGIGNILKLLRIDVVRRFSYLDHPGISNYGVKFSINIDF